MLDLKEIVETGIFSLDSHESLHSTMVSFNEQLVAQEFADEINSGRISVRDAYNYFWSYEEDKELWGVGGRALLPAWQTIMLAVASTLKQEKAQELVEIVNESYFHARIETGKQRYNPFLANLFFAAKRVGHTNIHKKSINKIVEALWWEKKYNFNQSDDIFKCLEETRSESAIKKLTEYLSNQKNVDLVMALKTIGKICGEKAVQILCNYINNPENLQREHAIYTLGHLNNKKIVDFLTEYIKGNNKEHIGTAFYVLGNINDEKGTDFIIDYVKKQEKYFDEALYALAVIDSKKTTEFLMNYAQNKKNKNREKAMFYLGQNSLDETALTFVINYASNSRNPYSERVLIYDLSNNKSEKAKEFIINYLFEQTGRYRKELLASLDLNIILKLGEVGGERATEVLIEYVMVDDPKDRYADDALSSLGRIGDEKSRDFLISYLKNFKNPYTHEAAYALAKIGDDISIDALIEFVLDHNNTDPMYSLFALGQTKNERATDFLITYVKNEKRPRWEEGLRALGNTNSEKATDFLIGYMMNKEKGYKGLVLNSLLQLGNKKAINFILDDLQEFRTYPSGLSVILNVAKKTGDFKKLNVLSSLIILNPQKDERKINDLDQLFEIYQTNSEVHSYLKPLTYSPPENSLVKQNASS
ncbi:MAG: hypothetical protein Q8O89_02970 [Nanoarchaeota archaeon]|nr:hypothetical protein [Nanoarchaeota archaeon]